ncbi:MAG TPA: S8 family serine peptidase, partial [Pyrinomonadaceae bacterium]
MNKVAPWVMEHTASGAETEFFVVMNDQADLSGASALKTKREKGRFVRDALWNKAQTTQGPMLKWLQERNVEHRSFYIVNMVLVKGDQSLALALASRPDVRRVEGNPAIHNFLPQPMNETDDAGARTNSTTQVEPGVNHTRAPEVWAQGYTGQGIVVGAADTGYRWDHMALKNKYRGWNGSTVNHNYNWHDSIHSGGGSCGANSAQPCDDNGHGTHTAGTAIGDDGVANQIGMAPGAKWIGCRNMNQGNGTPATYTECFEFFLAPYPVGGTPSQGDPDLSPDVTTNSWHCPPSEGCSATSLQAAVKAQRAAGIMTVVAAGNSGSSCSTVSDPPAIYNAAYTVGALNTGTDTIASFSSRGPVTSDGSNRPKPDIAAPGTSIRSSTRDSTTSYGSLSGTSMATPHVAGA